MSRAKHARAERTMTYPRWLPPVLLSVGGALAALCAYWLAGDYIGAFAGTRTVYSAGALMLMFAALPLFLGELFRRGKWTTIPRTSTTPETGIVRIRQLALPITLVWLAVPVLSWLFLVAVPVALMTDGVAFVDAGDGFAWIVGSVALLSSITTGFMIASLLGRASYARAQALGRTAPEKRRRVWRNVAGQSFPHFFLMAIGFASAGLIPVFLHLAFLEGRDVDTVAIAVMIAVAALSTAGGTVIATQLWRSGEQPGYLVNNGEGDLSLNFGG